MVGSFRENLLHVPLTAPGADSGSWRSLACRPIMPISLPVFTGGALPVGVCAQISRFCKDTSHNGSGPLRTRGTGVRKAHVNRGWPHTHVKPARREGEGGLAAVALCLAFAGPHWWGIGEAALLTAVSQFLVENTSWPSPSPPGILGWVSPVGSPGEDEGRAPGPGCRPGEN